MKGSTEEVNLNFIFKKSPVWGTEKENMVTIYYLLKKPWNVGLL